ncbi:hypothetical protein [Paracoccus yeei]|nr:hypothetical protein [Paracoccus yeei]
MSLYSCQDRPTVIAGKEPRMSMLNHLSALADRAIRATTPFSPRYSVA